MWSLKKVWVGSLHVLIQIPRHLLSSKYLHFSTNTPLDNDLPSGSVTEFTEHVPISHWHESAVALATIKEASWPLASGAKRALKRTSKRGGNSARSTLTADCSVSKALFPLIMRRFATSISPSYPGFWESHPTSSTILARKKARSRSSAKEGRYSPDGTSTGGEEQWSLEVGRRLSPWDEEEERGVRDGRAAGRTRWWRRLGVGVAMAVNKRSQCVVDSRQRPPPAFLSVRPGQAGFSFCHTYSRFLKFLETEQVCS